jgi:RNA polymerase sigma factor (sigma-70 family)
VLINSELHKEPVDQMLLERIAEGDEFAFSVLYRAYYIQLQPLIWKSAVAGVNAADILQSAFLKIWLHRQELPKLDDLKPWIFKVAYREYLMAVRKKIRYEDRLDHYSDIMTINNGPASPFQTTSYHEIRRHIQEIVNALPDQRRTIYQMSRDQGMKIAEIAEKLSLSTNTVKSVLQTVLKILRERLKAAGYDPLVIIFFLHFFISQ